MSSSEPTVYTWSPPIYDLSTRPELKQTYAIEAESNHENFARSARWTPDGSAFMTHCENRTLELFNSRFFYDAKYTATAQNSIFIFHQPAPILDFTWFPTASPNDPASFCFLASVRECPVKLLDASDGRLRASYKIVDHRERFVAPHCMTFSLDASRIYCGHEDAIEVFDVSRPGEGTRVPTTPSKKSKDGLKGIVSALAFSPTYGSSSDTFFAAGTLNPTLSNLALYNESHSDAPFMFIGGGNRSAITQLKFNPTNPYILYASYRRRRSILAWDLRSDVTTPFAKYVIPPPSTLNSGSVGMTNQKMVFDVDLCGTRLGVGDQEGNVFLWDLTTAATRATAGGEEEREGEGETLELQPDLVMNAHSDSVGGVAFHPYRPLLLTVSGSRHYNDDDDDGEEDEDSEGDDDDEGEEGMRKSASRSGEVRMRAKRTRPVTKESLIKSWYFPTNDSAVSS